MASWFRTWHGLPCDPKLRNVAKRCTRSIPEVLAVYMALLDYASQSDQRGSIEGIDLEDIEAMYDLDDAASIFNAMEGKLHNGKLLTGWDKRQPEREDNSTSRVRKHREKKRRETQCNGDETQRNAPEQIQSRTDTDTEEAATRETAPVCAATLSGEVEAIAGADSAKSQHWAIGAIPAADAWLESAKAFDIGPIRARELILAKAKEVRSRNPSQPISKPSYFTDAIRDALRDEAASRPTGGFSNSFGKPRVKEPA